MRWVLTAAFVAWASAASAQELAADGGLIVRPEPGSERLIPTYVPSKQDEARALPNGAPVSGRSVARCTVTADGGVTDCAVAVEVPVGSGLAEANLKTAQLYRFRPTDREGKPVAGQKVNLGRDYLAPGDRDLDWLAKPTAASLAAVYPMRALRDGIDGSARLHCRVTVEGFLERCWSSNEAPEGVGFGDAAVSLASQFAMTPKIRGGKPVEGQVTIPISWAGFKDTINPGNAARPLYSDTTWLQAPTAAAQAAAYPARTAKGEAGQAVLRCEVGSENRPIHCLVKSEIPANRGLGAAAKTLLPAFVVAVPSDGSMRVKEAMLDITFRFHSPTIGALGPLYDVRWMQTPSAINAEALFPKAARDAGLKAGAAEIDCLAAAEGRLTDCRMVRETAVGSGFGPAALEAAKSLRANPWTRAGEAVEGRRVVTVVSFATEPPSVKPTMPR